MPLEQIPSPCFERARHNFLKKYPLAVNDVVAAIRAAEISLEPCDRIPRLGLDVALYKCRFAMPSYRLGKSAGGRLVCLQVDQRLLLLTLYAKPDYRTESAVQAVVKRCLEEALHSLPPEPQATI